MEMKIKIKHQNGSKAGQVEEFAAQLGTLKIGRSSECQIQYDPDNDTVVSREHAVIKVDGADPETFWIEDLNSRNGLFLNGKPVTGKAKIYAGDAVQAGKNGPIFIFDLDPRPASHIKKTQVVDIQPAKPTTQSSLQADSLTGSGSFVPPAAPVKEGIGKETFERRISQERAKRKHSTLYLVAALLIIVVAAGLFLWKKFEQDDRKRLAERQALSGALLNEIDEKTRPGSKTAAQISEENTNTVVFIEVAWKLIYTLTGEDLVHKYITVNGAPQAAFQKTSEGDIEPVIIPRTPNMAYDYVPIQGAGTASGFVISTDGFILTNRHVAANWYGSYKFREGTFPGVLVDENGQYIPGSVVTADMVPNWIPVNTYNINNENASKLIEGVNMYMDVTFAGNELRIPAKTVRISNKHDVAMIKIDLPKKLPVVECNDNYDVIKTGDEVVLLGYPGISPDQFSQIESLDYFVKNPQLVSVPVPTLSTGNIGRLIAGSTRTSSGNYISIGDSYQLTINTTSEGNSGGPLFDNQGKVIGLYNAQSDKISFAVPIKYGLELMGVDPVIESR